MLPRYSSTFALLILILLSSGTIGGFSQAVLNAITVVMMVALVLSTFSMGLLITGHSIAALVGSTLAVSWIVLFPSQGYESRLLVLVVFCFFLARGHSVSHSPTGSLYTVLGMTAFIFFAVSLMYHTEPIAWFLPQFASEAFSFGVGKLTAQLILMNATASGIWISFAFILFGFFVTLSSQRSRGIVRFFVYALAIILSNAVYISITHLAARWAQSLLTDIEVHPMNLLFLLFLLDGLPLYWFLKSAKLVPHQFDMRTVKWVPLTVSLSCFALWGAITFLPLHGKASLPNKVLVYDKGYFNWDKPAFGRYGIRASGMFGMLPDYLDVMGYSLKKDSLLTDEDLKGVGVVVVINLNKRMPDDEKARLRSFVSKGGSLLVLGDHTNLGGMMGPLNDLLDFVKVRFRFDCGHYLKKDWRDAFELIPHRIFSGMKDELDLGISVGASLDCSPITARPLLVGKYGFSDRGDPGNDKDAYLGDRRYNPGELLGDVILVAEARYGDGKVIIFGDTSSFQNGALIYSIDFVENVFRYLLAHEDSWNSLSLRMLSLLLIILGAGIQIKTASGWGQTASMEWVAIAALTAIAILGLVGRSETRINVQRHRLAYIDASHLNRFSQYGDDGIWALSYHLMRNDYLPVVRREFSPVWLQHSSVAFFLAPAREPSLNRIEEIDSYARHGGVAVWSFGYEEKEPVTSVMTKYGVGIDNIPLGPIPNNETSQGVRFHKAWPIEIVGGGPFDTLCTGWGYPVIITKGVGTGRIAVVSDPGFFLSENLELNHAAAKSNALFLQMISKTQTDSAAISKEVAKAESVSR